MAVSPVAAYPSNVDTSDPVGYPLGKARDVSPPGSGNGTPYTALLHNDIFGFQQALLAAAGIVPTGTPDKVGASQYLQALQTLFAAGAADVTNFTRTVNQYDLTAASPILAPLIDTTMHAGGALITVGPTGSGASKIWTALDVLPPDAAVLDVYVAVRITFAAGAYPSTTPGAYICLRSVAGVSPMDAATPPAAIGTPWRDDVNNRWHVDAKAPARVHLDGSNRFAYAIFSNILGVGGSGNSTVFHLRGFSR